MLISMATTSFQIQFPSPLLRSMHLLGFSLSPSWESQSFHHSCWKTWQERWAYTIEWIFCHTQVTYIHVGIPGVQCTAPTEGESRRSTSCDLSTGLVLRWLQRKPHKEVEQVWQLGLYACRSSTGNECPVAAYPPNIYIKQSGSHPTKVHKQKYKDANLPDYSPYIPTPFHCSKPLVEDLLKLENEGILVYDHQIGSEVLLFAPVLCIIADNVRASEVASHLGGKAIFYCRVCLVRVT